jgi:hypothetical protein
MEAQNTIVDYTPSDEEVMVEVLRSFTTLEEIEALEGELLNNVEPVNIPVKYGFCKGLHTRQITLPKGIIAIGHAHSGECLNIVTAGSVSVVIDGEVKRITAPCQFVSAPLGRKVGFVHEDCTWITVHATHTTDIDELEKELLVKSPTFTKYKLDNPECTEIVNAPRDEFWIDRVDYFKAVKELGVDHQKVRSQSENTSDLVEFEPGKGDKVYVGSSLIQGSGMFSSFGATKGEVLCAARIGTKRTKAGRYTNHARYPNAEMVPDHNGDINLVALSDIMAGEEITVDYRQARKASEVADRSLNLNTQ